MDSSSDSEFEVDSNIQSADLQDSDSELVDSGELPQQQENDDQQQSRTSDQSSGTITSTSADIARGNFESPVQPLAKFHTTLFGAKRRSFNGAWYEKYTWLEYSVNKDAAFCYACRFFAIGTSSDALTKNLFL